MKLLSKTDIYFFGASSIIFILGGILFYLLFQVIINADINKKLRERKVYTLKQLQRSDSLMLFQKYSVNMLSIKMINAISNHKDQVSDTTIFDSIENKSVSFRQLSFQARSEERRVGKECR